MEGSQTQENIASLGVTLPSGPKQVLDPKVNPDPFDSIDVGGGGSIGWGRFIF